MQCTKDRKVLLLRSMSNSHPFFIAKYVLSLHEINSDSKSTNADKISQLMGTVHSLQSLVNEIGWIPNSRIRLHGPWQHNKTETPHNTQSQPSNSQICWCLNNNRLRRTYRVRNWKLKWHEKLFYSYNSDFKDTRTYM